MDFSTLNLTQYADTGARFVPTHPVTGEDLPVEIWLKGADSELWQTEERKYNDKRLKDMTKRGKLPDLTSEELDERGIRLLAAVTVRWAGIEWEGKPVDCSPQNARFIYRNLKWLREQVDAFVGDRANFGDFKSEPAPSVFSGEGLIAAATENFPDGAHGDSATPASVGQAASSA